MEIILKFGENRITGSGGETMLLAKGKVDQPTDAIIDRFAG
jgi:hypothetical protein